MDSDFTLGIEEEYLLVDLDTLDLAEAPNAMMEACSSELGDQVSPEFLQCQVEVGTRVCRNVAEAREDLRHLRRTVARIAGDYGLAPIAAGCHPFSDWRDQHHTDKDRYHTLRSDLAAVSRRMLICGMHVHVGIESADQRIDLMRQLRYFLPHVLALSCSSPYWQGEDTGLASYRLTVFDNLPRTGLPPEFDSWGAYERSVAVLTDLGLIEDATKIWWDLRPSHRFPTLEARICDVTPRLETTLSLAALIQALTRMLSRLSQKNQRWRVYDRFLIAENRWRAQRYGIAEPLIDFGAHSLLPFPDIVEELIALTEEDGAALGSSVELGALRAIVERGTAADEQRQVYDAGRAEGRDHDAALRGVVSHLVETFHSDL